MTLLVRIFLIIGAVLTTVFFGLQVRKGKLQINYALFWIVFAGLLVIVSIFPELVISLAQILGFQSPANFLFLLIIFVLFIREFYLTIQLSLLEEKVKNLSQKIAIKKSNTTCSKETTHIRHQNGNLL